jgi:hypothetical protein
VEAPEAEAVRVEKEAEATKILPLSNYCLYMKLTCDRLDWMKKRLKPRALRSLDGA